MSSAKALERGPAFALVAIEPLEVIGPPALLDCDLMSPFVWRNADGGFSMLLRAVPNPRDDDVTGRIWYGEGAGDGLRFHADDAPLIAPGPGSLDIRGCEDPTMVPAGRECVVYYTGLDEHGNGQMLYCAGPDIRHLTKRGVALASSKTERNTKEAAVERTGDGHWRLFYEYSRGCQSRVGLAYGPGPHGPWDEQHDPFEPRTECWDSWHLSTGPLLMTDNDAPMMFYNGADRDSVWGVGWIVFDRDCSAVVARSDVPLIAPPAHPHDGHEISFAASAIETDAEIWLYLTRNDCRLYRARVQRCG